MTLKRLTIWFSAVLLFAILSRWQLERSRWGKCAFDGGRLTAPYEVDLVRDGTVLRRFCCVTCAQHWPQSAQDAYWQVRDEKTGELLDAETAVFVESGVVTMPSTGDRTHVFREWTDALVHEQQHAGRRIRNPLRRPATAAEPMPADDLPLVNADGSLP